MGFDYHELLERARNRIAPVLEERSRFQVPKARGRIEGKKTIVTNFNEIADVLRRPKEHILKFILRELAAPGEVRGNNLVLGAVIPASRVNEKIIQYCNEFVFCPDCGKPDTDLKREGQFVFLFCSVCGAKHAVRSKI